ncbi:MAG: hypothetical protein ACFFCS_23545 [Candidatus Hodarchaeota archaeon]
MKFRTFLKRVFITAFFLISVCFLVQILSLDTARPASLGLIGKESPGESCPAWPGPYQMTQPNGYTFFATCRGDENGIQYYLVSNDDDFGMNYSSHPIVNIDGWWYICYYNESDYMEVVVYEGGIVGMGKWGYWHYNLVNTGIRVGDQLPSGYFALVQIDGDSFYGRLVGSSNNPRWESLSGELIIQVMMSVDNESKAVWHYAELDQDGRPTSTGVPVDEDELELGENHELLIPYIETSNEDGEDVQDVDGGTRSISEIVGNQLIVYLPVSAMVLVASLMVYRRKNR